MKYSHNITKVVQFCFHPKKMIQLEFGNTFFSLVLLCILLEKTLLCTTFHGLNLKMNSSPFRTSHALLVCFTLSLPPPLWLNPVKSLFRCNLHFKPNEEVMMFLH